MSGASEPPGVERRAGGVEMRESGGEAHAERRSYAVGFVLAIVLTAIPFALVGLDVVDRSVAPWAVGALALVQVVVHFRFFLHIDLSRQKREDLQLILFTTLILILMCGGTIWILLDLYGRMMPTMASG